MTNNEIYNRIKAAGAKRPSNDIEAWQEAFKVYHANGGNTSDRIGCLGCHVKVLSWFGKIDRGEIRLAE